MNITILDKDTLIEVKIINKMIMNIKGVIIMIMIDKTLHLKIDSNK